MVQQTEKGGCERVHDISVTPSERTLRPERCKSAGHYYKGRVESQPAIQRFFRFIFFILSRCVLLLPLRLRLVRSSSYFTKIYVYCPTRYDDDATHLLHAALTEATCSKVVPNEPTQVAVSDLFLHRLTQYSPVAFFLLVFSDPWFLEFVVTRDREGS